MRNIFLLSLLLTSGITFLSGTINAQIQQVRLQVDGLACPFCVFGLEKHLKKIKYFDRYDINLKTGTVIIYLKENAKVDLDDFKKAVKDAGFTLRNISVQAKGTIERYNNEFMLHTGKNSNKFALFSKKSKTLSEDLRNKFDSLKQQGKTVIIEGIIHEHKDSPPGLSIDHYTVSE